VDGQEFSQEKSPPEKLPREGYKDPQGKNPPNHIVPVDGGGKDILKQEKTGF